MNVYLPEIGPEILTAVERTGLSPEEVFPLFAGTERSAFLNSSLQTDVGRFAFIGLYPFCVIKSFKKDLYVDTPGKQQKIHGDPFDLLETVFSKYKVRNPTASPFAAGGIGYFSYDLKNLIEKLPDAAKDDLLLPELYFTLYQAILIFDRTKPGSLTVSVLDVQTEQAHTAYDILEGIKEKLIFARETPAEKQVPLGLEEPVSNFTKSGYIAAIKKVKEYISAGDIYQACLSQRFSTKYALSPYSLYLKLNSVNPSPFSAFLDTGDCAIMSSSPELFLRVRCNKAETRPMKGTRPRGKDDKMDFAMQKDLASSVKDAAELAMIVDIERNDLGRIAVPGSVEVSEPRRVEKYPTVFQTISVIKADLDKQTSLPGVIKAAFPGGSISGCPKIRAMEIIDELEPTKRGIYTGSIGYMSFHNTMDLNIAIRTIIQKNDHIYYQAGGGITVDSDPEEEYKETLHKAKAFFDAIR